MKNKQFLFCFLQTKTCFLQPISAQLSQLFRPPKGITLNPLFSLQERREGNTSFYIERDDEKKYTYVSSSLLLLATHRACHPLD